jgi:hypothetical protein
LIKFILISGWQNAVDQKHIFSYIPKFDADGFLQYSDGERLVWIPAHLRGESITAFNNIVAIGGQSGAITFIRTLG